MSHSKVWVFDVDGTLVDSNDLHARAWYDAFLENDFSINYDVIRSLIGMGKDKMLPRLTGRPAESELGKRIASCRVEFFSQRYLSEVRAFSQSLKLLDYLAEQGVTLAVASSASKEELGAILKKTDLEDRFEILVSSEDVDASKPSPDVLQSAMNKSHAQASHTRFVGDTPYDIEAAAILDVRTLCVRSGGWLDAMLTGALRTFEDVSDLHACLLRENGTEPWSLIPR